MKPLDALTSVGIAKPDLIEFSDAVALVPSTLNLQTITSLEDALQAQDAVDVGRDELLRSRYELAVVLSAVERDMRRIERRFLAENPKPTVAERLYSTDEEHSNLEALKDQLKGGITLCDGLLALFDDKSFKLTQLIRRFSNPVQ